MTETPPPLDPEQARVQRILKIVVVGLGVLILIVLGVIVTTIAGRMGTPTEEVEITSPAPSLDAVSGLVTLPEGAEVTHMALDGGLLALHVRGADGWAQVLIVDLASGAVRGRLTLVTP